MVLSFIKMEVTAKFMFDFVTLQFISSLDHDWFVRVQVQNIYYILFLSTNMSCHCGEVSTRGGHTLRYSANQQHSLLFI